MRLSFYKSPMLAGIDIQPDGVCLVQLKHHKYRFLLEKMAWLPLVENVYSEEKIAHWDKLTSLLFDWLQELNLPKLAVSAALPLQQVGMVRMDSTMPASEPAIHAYLAQQFPGMTDDLAVDYCQLPNNVNSLLIAAAKRHYLDNYVSCLTDAGWNLKIIDIDVFALRRAVGNWEGAIVWQQRKKMHLIWQDEKQLPRQVQWTIVAAEQTLSELTRSLIENNIKEALFCGATYYADLLKRTKELPAAITYFKPPFDCSERNVSDYLLAIGLAMRKVPVW